MNSSKLGTAVAASLAATLLACVLSIAVLAGLERPPPGVLENLAAGALGALAALLARVGGTEDVRVVNRADDPVPVDPDAGHADGVFVIVGTFVVALGVVLGTLLLRLL